MSRHIATYSLLICLLSTAAAQAQTAASDSTPRGFIAGGVGVTPEFDGAEDLRVLPFGVADVYWRGLTLELRGLRGRVDLVSDPRIGAGPVFNVRLARDDADGAVGRLPEIDRAIEAGAFVSFQLGPESFGQPLLQFELTALHDVSDTHEGFLAGVQVFYALLRGPDVSIALDAQMNYADQDYTATYFGVSSPDAGASGLRAHSPGSGLRDVGAGMTINYLFPDSRFGILGRLGGLYLLGDSADSPVVEEGRRWQPTAGVAVSYRF